MHIYHCVPTILTYYIFACCSAAKTSCAPLEADVAKLDDAGASCFLLGPAEPRAVRCVARCNLFIAIFFSKFDIEPVPPLQLGASGDGGPVTVSV